MIYDYLTNNGVVTRKVLHAYISKNKLEAIKSKKMSVEEYYKAFLSYRNNVANRNIIELEDRWFEAVSSNDIVTRDLLESNHGYLKGLRGERTSLKRRLVEVTKLSKEEVKEIIRLSRDVEVRTLEETISDLAKLVSFNYSITRAVYGVMSEEDKNKIDPATRGLIEFSLDKFGTTDTRADRQLKTDGTALITALMTKEEQIADIIDNVKKLNND